MKPAGKSQSMPKGGAIVIMIGHAKPMGKAPKSAGKAKAKGRK